jgi:hypothetical protein
MVRDLLAAKRVEDASETVDARRPVGLSEWFSASRYLPEEIMLNTLAEVDSELADRHRELGSGKQTILRDVRSCLAANGGGAIA